MLKGQSTPKIHPSVEALLQAHPDFSRPEGAIVHLAKEKLKFAKLCGWVGPPFCPERFCSIHGIRCVQVEDDIRCDGRILRDPKTGRAIIQYAKGRSIERTRFTIFHEFAHTLFPDYCEYVSQHHNKQGGNSERDRFFENLCDLAAAELLFPEDDFTRSLEKTNLYSLAEVVELAELYRGSLEATCRRIGSLEQRRAVTFLFITDKRKAGYFGEGSCWVRNFAKTAPVSSVIMPGTSPPVGSAVYACLESEEPMEISTETHERWLTRAGHEDFKVQMIRLPKVNCEASPKAIVLLA